MLYHSIYIERNNTVDWLLYSLLYTDDVIIIILTSRREPTVYNIIRIPRLNKSEKFTLSNDNIEFRQWRTKYIKVIIVNYYDY